LGSDVLIIWDKLGPTTTALKNALLAAGMNVTLSDHSETAWVGNDPSPAGFDAVVLLDGSTPSTEMPSTGQAALRDYVANGRGGLVSGEWLGTEHDDLSFGGHYLGMTDVLLLVVPNGGGQADLTIDEVPAQSSHPVLASVPSSFTVTNAGFGIGTPRTYGVDEPVVLAYDAVGNPAILVREHGTGRAVSFMIAANFGSELNDANVRALYVDGVRWAACDLDQDGLRGSSCPGGGIDCDDTNAAITVASPWFYEGDTDGYGRSDITAIQCSAPPQYVAAGGDCDDTRPFVNPGQLEACDAANLDEDCDGLTEDSDPSATGKSTYYADDDHDGYGAGAGELRCDADAGFPVTDATDCDDSNFSANPGETEVCDAGNVDEDCDARADNADPDSQGRVDFYIDADADGWGVGTGVALCDPTVQRPARAAGDCNDAVATISPGSPELCDPGNVDEDCDGVADDADPSRNGATAWYTDGDADGFGTSPSITACDPDGQHPSAFGNDCDDADATISPGVPEVCDPSDIDEDCDGQADDDDASVTGTDAYHADADSDGYGGAASADRCDPDASFPLLDASDCDDADPAVNPLGSEICDAADADEDCDGAADDDDSSASGQASFYADQDDDGFGTGSAVARCDGDSAHPTDVDGDCDDADPTVSPGSTERCDPADADEDCDGTADDADPTATGQTRWYTDGDADAFGVGAGVLSCDAIGAFVTEAAGDCDDGDASVSPGALEQCDPADVDEDCDGDADDADGGANGGTPYYADGDADGFGGPTSDVRCDPSAAFPLATTTDCDDADAAVNPAASEICDLADVDEDCDGASDDQDPSVTGTSAFYADSDGDGFGVGAASQRCDGDTAHPASVDGDCDDADSGRNPGTDEVCDPADVDEDCDALADDADPSVVDQPVTYADADSDGFGEASRQQCDADPAFPATVGGDCDATDPTINPGAVERCDVDDADEDCDGLADDADPDVDPTTLADWWPDADADGQGDATAAPSALCDDPSAPNDAWSADDLDCDDADASSYVGAAELAYDGIDQDCDGADLDDADHDGHAATAAGGDDCQDGDASIHPGAIEVLDGVDQNCDGVVDEATDAYDDDGDGYSELGGDCDDSLAAIGPAAVEICDGIDQDCDLDVDEETSCFDDDFDGFDEDTGDCDDANPDVGPGSAEIPDNGVDDDCDGTIDGGIVDSDGDGTADADDCEPADATIHPGAAELVDGIDQDCDGLVDDGTSVYDDDGDGFSEDDGDCDDADDARAPDLVEVADGVDEDCDGVVDDGTEAYDDDRDGFTELGGDCDDADATVNPGASEVPNDGVDNDCDGVQPDPDGDGDGSPAAEDCDDTDPLIYPGAADGCDGVDNDCDGDVDEDGVDCPSDSGEREGGCKCDAAGEPSVTGWALLSGLAAWARWSRTVRRTPAPTSGRRSPRDRARTP
jgi:hypothetical protein